MQPNRRPPVVWRRRRAIAVGPGSGHAAPPWRRATGAVVLAVGLAAAPGAARAQADSPFGDADIAGALQALSVFGALPGVSAATYRVEEGPPSESRRFSSFKLPLSWRLDPVAFGVRPYGELTLGYVNSDLSFRPDASSPATVDADLDAFTGLAGLGADIRLRGRWRLRPVVLFGVGHTRDALRLPGNLDEVLRPEIAESLGVGLTSLLAGGALALRYRAPLDGGRDLELELRYNHLVSHAVSASSEALEGTETFGIGTARAEVAGPTGLALGDRPIRWIGFAAATLLPGNTRENLGFGFFAQLGGGLSVIDPTVIEGVEGAALRVSGILGDRVTGVSVALALEF